MLHQLVLYGYGGGVRLGPMLSRHLLVGRDNLKAHVSGTMTGLIAARDWLMD